MAKYKDNEYGFIGGGLEAGEDFRQSLFRELSEEIGFKNDQINEIHEVKENYMYMSKINVDKQKLENEFSKNLNIFKFYIIEAENLDKIKSNELEKFDIEMIDLDSLFSEKYIPFPDIIRILKPNFVV